jgi:uncharacterized membrane protein
MKKFLVLSILAVVMAVMGTAAFAGEAKVTFNNKTDNNVYVALCWVKHESETRGVWWKRGWYKIEPGKSRTLSQQGVRYTWDMGYYAFGTGKNRKKIYWGGTSGSAALIGGIHPTKSFDTSDCFFEGSEDVRFREIGLKKNGDNFAATVNLSS